MSNVVYKVVIHIRFAKLRISRRTFNLEYSPSHLHKCNIECSTTKVKDQDLQIFLDFVEAICKRGRSWLVNYPYNLQACYLTGVLSCLSLIVVKVCWSCYH